jgi:hypothetical protein
MVVSGRFHCDVGQPALSVKRLRQLAQGLIPKAVPAG